MCPSYGLNLITVTYCKSKYLCANIHRQIAVKASEAQNPNEEQDKAVLCPVTSLEPPHIEPKDSEKWLCLLTWEPEAEN